MPRNFSFCGIEKEGNLGTWSQLGQVGFLPSGVHTRMDGLRISWGQGGLSAISVYLSPKAAEASVKGEKRDQGVRRQEGLHAFIFGFEWLWCFGSNQMNFCVLASLIKFSN